MAKFRGKPVVIEAIQYNGPFTFDDMAHAWGDDFKRIAAPYYDTKGVVAGILIKTLEGEMRGDPLDWIIKGTRGEFYPCKPDVFSSKYEPA